MRTNTFTYSGGNLREEVALRGFSVQVQEMFVPNSRESMTVDKSLRFHLLKNRSTVSGFIVLALQHMLANSDPEAGVIFTCNNLTYKELFFDELAGLKLVWFLTCNQNQTEAQLARHASLGNFILKAWTDTNTSPY